MENYFNYFTEIEVHFCRRRGTLLQLPPKDWSLIETWKDAGIPLEAVLRGIDETFDRYDARPSKTRKVNSLAYCAQAVLGAAEDMREASVGTSRAEAVAGPTREMVGEYLGENAKQFLLAAGRLPMIAGDVVNECGMSLRNLAAKQGEGPPYNLEELERQLTVMEEKVVAALMTVMPDVELLKLRTEADLELASFRGKLPAMQLQQVHSHYVRKRLLELHALPRLSLFYM